LKRLLTSTALVLVLWQQPALAGTEIADPVIAQIQAEGYTISDVTRTWLGRIVITAQMDSSQREIVLNRTTGEVLRDRMFPQGPQSNGAAMPATGMPAAPSSGSMGGSGASMGGGGGNGDGGMGGGGGNGGGGRSR
jgi:uncharacterized membrane protein YgcG